MKKKQKKLSIWYKMYATVFILGVLGYALYPKVVVKIYNVGKEESEQIMTLPYYSEPIENQDDLDELLSQLDVDNLYQIKYFDGKKPQNNYRKNQLKVIEDMLLSVSNYTHEIEWLSVVDVFEGGTKTIEYYVVSFTPHDVDWGENFHVFITPKQEILNLEDLIEQMENQNISIEQHIKWGW